MAEQEKQQFMAEQVEATMDIENMPLTAYDKQNVTGIITGSKTIEQVRKELDEKYNE